MTDTTEPTSGAPAPGWWQASDGGWYPPTQQPGPGTPPPPYPTRPAVAASNGMATAAMVLGIIAVVLFWAFGLSTLIGIVAIVLGAVALKRANTLPGRTGRGQAIAGIVTGTIGALAGVLLLVGIVALGEEAEDRFREVGESLDEGVNTDPADGWCNEDRWLQDPDC